MEYITKDEAIQLARKYHVDIGIESYIAIVPGDLHILFNKVIQRYIDSLVDNFELPKPAGGFSFVESDSPEWTKSWGAEFYSAQQMRDAIAKDRILMSRMSRNKSSIITGPAI